jgi:hypothetical protein
MKSLKISISIASLVLILSCSKDPESSGYTVPIAVLSPATDPSTTIKGMPINYKIVITNDEYVDSIQVFSQVDSTNLGYSESRDSLVYKMVYPTGAKSNNPTIESTYLPKVFPPVGKKIYLTFWARSKTRHHKKKVTLEVR